MKHTWDIFCSVVDNYGDIGVCWRLARQLASDVGQPVRLWVDDLASFHRICRAVDPAHDAQLVGAVEIRQWRRAFPQVEPASIVVEGFGVKLPDNYVAAMAARTPHPVWINLEHLSAEPWVDGCHALPSPHPALPLTKYFFFPGFTPATGGLLMERGLAQARDAFQADAQARARFWEKLGVAPNDEAGIRISLFCYQNAALPALTSAWAAGDQAVTCVVPAGAALAQLAAILGEPLQPGTCAVRGRLRIAAIPFLDVDQYDRLLWACDINFVRGEDSFVRAQLAARPLVWQAYVQSEDSHIEKQAAFLDRYVEGLDDAAAAALRAIHDVWNRQSGGIAPCWRTFMDTRAEAAGHARAWAARIASGGSLAIKLAEFCQDRLE
jgi:uncharacterized repeat protein (TIGR03837 family)